MNQNKVEFSQISLYPTLIVRYLGIIGFSLIVASSVGAIIINSFPTIQGFGKQLCNLFNAGYEHNFPAYYSSFLLLFSALLLFLITIIERNQNGSHVLHWAFLSFLFLCFAIDEALALHERIVHPLQENLSIQKYGIFYYTWVIPGIASIIIIAIIYLRFFLRLKAKIKRTFLTAAILFIAGAIGFELIEGRYDELYGQDLFYNMMVSIEEGLEMAGPIVFIWGLLFYISDSSKAVQFEFKSTRNKSISDTKT